MKLGRDVADGQRHFPSDDCMGACFAAVKQKHAGQRVLKDGGAGRETENGDGATVLQQPGAKKTGVI